MATSEEAKAYAAEQRRIIDAAERALTAWLAANTDATPDDIVQFVLSLVGQFANAAAEHALAWYTALRSRAADQAGSGKAGRFQRGSVPNFSPEPVDAFDAGSIARDTLWALKQADPAASLSQVVDQHVAQAGKDTIRVNAEKDPANARWARMPIGVTCAWCLMLASRGAAYASRKTATYAADGGKYHGRCDCEPVPVWDHADIPYDADALYQVYLDARQKAGGDPNAITAQIRRDHWDEVADGVPPDPRPADYFERSAREAYWDRRQDAIGLDFKGERLKPLEIETVERLVRLDETIDWIPQDLRGATNDFRWADAGGIEVEMKSLLPTTPADLTHIRRPILKAGKKAPEVKKNWLVDVSPRPLESDLLDELRDLAGAHIEGVDIQRLWVLSATGLTEIPAK